MMASFIQEEDDSEGDVDAIVIIKRVDVKEAQKLLNAIKDRNPDQRHQKRYEFLKERIDSIESLNDLGMVKLLRYFQDPRYHYKSVKLFVKHVKRVCMSRCVDILGKSRNPYRIRELKLLYPLIPGSDKKVLDASISIMRKIFINTLDEDEAREVMGLNRDDYAPMTFSLPEFDFNHHHHYHNYDHGFDYQDYYQEEVLPMEFFTGLTEYDFPGGNLNNNIVDYPIPPPFDKDVTKENGSCCVCLERDASTVIVPCGHSIICGVCSQTKYKDCPKCRTAIQQIIRLYN